MVSSRNVCDVDRRICRPGKFNRTGAASDKTVQNKQKNRSLGLRRLCFRIVALREKRRGSQLKARSGSILVPYSDGRLHVWNLVEPSTSVFEYDGLSGPGDHRRYQSILQSVLAHMMYAAFLSKVCDLAPMIAIMRPNEETESSADDFGFSCLMSVSLPYHNSTAQLAIAPEWRLEPRLGDCMVFFA